MEHGEWPGADGYPVILNTRPGRNRGRLATDYPHQRQTVYYQDGNGLLVPAGAAIGGGLHRSHSAAARRPAQIVINNSQYEDRSVSRSPHGHSHNRRSSHGRHYNDDSEDEYHDRAFSPHRRRRPSRSHESRSHESRSPSPYYDFELDKKMKKLEELEEKEKEDIAREKYEEELLLKEAKKAKKKKEEEELKQKAIEEYHLQQLEEKAKKDKEKKEADEEFRERVKKTFGQAGYDEESIEKILKKGEKGEKGEKGKEHGKGKEIKIKDLTRPTYIKVHRKHVSPETLDEYNLPWEWDERDSNYIVIKQWIPEQDQIVLFDHTKKLRERKLITDSTVELKRERDTLLLRAASVGNDDDA
ncbi:MAG: hypothetical protein ASARMPRED_008581 [Alectoria sarmentosa]|nr:MAG: hypothetical protein ASARMPRED_008581 [Alectoria sarmentosa]